MQEKKVTYQELARQAQKKEKHQIVLAIADGKIRELFQTAKEGEEISFLTTADRIGHDTWVRSAVMLLMKAASDVAGSLQKGKLKVEFSIGRGLYCSPRDGRKVDITFIDQVRERMRELAAQKIPFEKMTKTTDDAIALFESQGMADKVQLFRYRRASCINVYELDGYYDYNYGYMVPDTGYIDCFDLFPYQDGLMLLLPERRDPEQLPVFEERKKLFKALEDSTRWGEKLGITTVGDLNDKICGGDLAELILVQEAMQESRIGRIAEDIAGRKGVKFVMIAGPSSSGKTSFSHRLSIQLRTHGLHPHPIALDNYFKDRKDTPVDENGNFDFECLEAIDVEQFNEDMTRLLAGERVELPTFNFVAGRREYNGDYRKLGPNDILVIEGIHGLNDKLSYSLPKESKFKIYISALTQINIDEHNRISTTDGRLIRRMVRDARTRGTTAEKTIAMWSSVRRGEDKYIFPFQEEADVMFNSALIYELAVLKPYAESILFGIPKNVPEYIEAKRLLKFLDYFIGISSEDIPKNSLMREFVGGSVFRV
mgnify:CR=1 FL=1